MFYIEILRNILIVILFDYKVSFLFLWYFYYEAFFREYFLNKKISFNIVYLLTFSIVLISILKSKQYELLPFTSIIISSLVIIYNLFILLFCFLFKKYNSYFYRANSISFIFIEIFLYTMIIIIGLSLRTHPTKLWIPLFFLILLMLIRKHLYIIINKEKF